MRGEATLRRGSAGLTSSCSPLTMAPMRAIAFSAFGSPDVLRLTELPDPVATGDQVIVKTAAIGMNYADIYRRRGDYHLVDAPPFILGYEAAGIVHAVGPAVTEFAPGDRVAFADVPRANAELVVAPSDHLVPVPSEVPLETAAALLLQGLTPSTWPATVTSSGAASASSSTPRPEVWASC